jgi:hypothetical protein
MPERDCPDCGAKLSGSTCECGWVATAKHSNRPPLAEEVLANFLRSWLLAGNRMPYLAPSQPADAAEWWMAMQEPPESGETPYRRGQGWHTPYHDRLIYTLRKFLVLPDDDQRFVVAAVEDRTWWRGEDMGMFRRIVDETERCRQEGQAEYRAKAVAMITRFLSAPEAKKLVRSYSSEEQHDCPVCESMRSNLLRQ